MHALLLAATLSILPVDLAVTLLDPTSQPQAAAESLVLGPAPTGYAPLVAPGTGLSVTNVRFTGTLRSSLGQTAAAFQRDLWVAGELLPAGIFLGTGSAAAALPPDGATGTTTNLARYEGDSLAEVMTGGAWSYDGQRLRVDVRADGQTSSLVIRWVFGTEEYPEYVGSTYNDVFGCFLFEAGERTPSGLAYATACDTPSWSLPQADQSWLLAHQIAFDAGGAPITVNGPFFSGGQVVLPPANGLEYDGATRVLTTVAPLVPGGSYSLYFVIADTDDANYDSGVFLSLGGSGAIVSDPGTTSTTLGGGGVGGGGSGGGTGGSGAGGSAGSSASSGSSAGASASSGASGGAGASSGSSAAGPKGGTIAGGATGAPATGASSNGNASGTGSCAIGAGTAGGGALPLLASAWGPLALVLAGLRAGRRRRAGSRT